jgi:hypothetical protein
VKIVYTNLTEDDYGVKRSVKQLHLDFNRTIDQKGLSKDKRLREESRRGHLALVSDTRDQRRSNDYERERQRTRLKQNEVFLYKTVKPVQSLKSRSVAGYYIDKFVKSQSLHGLDNQKGTLIDIFV